MVDTGLVKDQRAIEPLDAMQAWSKFKNLPTYVQQIFAEQVLFNLLTRVGEDYNNAASPYFQKYSRGYEAINTLFPASFGYTANNLGAAETVRTRQSIPVILISGTRRSRRNKAEISRSWVPADRLWLAARRHRRRLRIQAAT